VIDPRVGWVARPFIGLALILSLMAETGKSLSQLAAELPPYTIVKDKYEVPRERLAAALDALAARWPSEGGPARWPAAGLGRPLAGTVRGPGVVAGGERRHAVGDRRPQDQESAPARVGHRADRGSARAFLERVALDYRAWEQVVKPRA